MIRIQFRTTYAIMGSTCGCQASARQAFVDLCFGSSLETNAQLLGGTSLFNYFCIPFSDESLFEDRIGEYIENKFNKSDRPTNLHA